MADLHMDFSDVFKVSQTVIMGITSIATILAVAPNIQQGLMAARAIHGLLTQKFPRSGHIPMQEESSISQTSNKSYKWQLQNGNVAFNSVSFCYPTEEERNILHDVSWNVDGGKTVALVGPPGCGKTTCMYLLLRFFDTEWGTVTVDGMNVSQLTTEKLRSYIAFMPQQPMIFSRSVIMNIAYGDNTRIVDMDEIIRAAEMANAHNFIEALPGVSIENQNKKKRHHRERC